MKTHIRDSISRIKKSKYLTHFAEPEVFMLDGFPRMGSITPIVVPVYNEALCFFNTMQPKQKLDEPILWIIVVNTPVGCDKSSHFQTQQLLDHLLALGECSFKSAHLSLIKASLRQWVLLVNRIQNPIPQQQGVGLARKIGFDIACHLMVEQKLTLSWIATTDADARLPKNFLTPLSIEPGFRDAVNSAGCEPSALIFPFQHTSNQTDNASLSQSCTPRGICRVNMNNQDKQDLALVMAATTAYEKHLNYYVEGLTFARSPYAYHTLGSTIVADPVAYCLARGFPKRAAGEDFYLLNKLNKIAPVKSLKTDPILINARISDRVPFGTGPAVARLIKSSFDEAIDKVHPNDSHPISLKTYHPDTFIWLKDWLTLLNEIAAFKSIEREQRTAHALISQSFPAKAIAEELGFLNVLPKLNKQNTCEASCKKALFHWFDAFKTVKFVNLISHQYLQKVNMSDSIEHYFKGRDE